MAKRAKPKGPARPRGRPSKFKPDMVDQAKRLTRMGMTMTEIADFFGVHVDCVRRWRLAMPVFDEAFVLVLKEANEKVEVSLFKQAVGYHMDSEEIKVIDGKIVRVPIRVWYPPSASAAIYWSKIKMGWRDDQPQTPAEGQMIEGTTNESVRQVARRVALILYQGGKVGDE